ncbi:MAG TPA: hypothetical protein VIK77_03860 [Tissierellaceae bacterium]|jgi:hypothetical protein
MKKIVYKLFSSVLIFTIVLLSILILTITLTRLHWYKEKLEIIKLVNNNLDFLNQCIQNETYDKIYELKKVKQIRKFSLDNDDVYIEFYCTGFGIVPSSVYIGFYYVSNDRPTPYRGDSYELELKGKGWQWKQPSGDNWYYTEKIADHWYFYQAGF